MDGPGQTISATQFAALTGVSRERLRTWERRYGFPVPRRTAGAPRRYAVADADRVVAVRRAAAEGVPLPLAIAQATAETGHEGPGLDALAALVQHLPVPVAAISGPSPMQIEYVNEALRALPGGPRAGTELTRAAPAFAGTPCERTLKRLFATDAAPVEVHHPAWGGHARHAARSTLLRLPTRPGQLPLVAMVGLEGDGERALRTAIAAQRRELEELRPALARLEGDLELATLLADVLRRQIDPDAAIAEGLGIVVRRTQAVDAGLAVHASGTLVLRSSSRGSLRRGAAATIAAHPALSRALSAAGPVWLEGTDSVAVGAAAGLQVCAIPLAVAGEPLGVLLIGFHDAPPLDPERRRLFGLVGGAFGFALLRARLVEELRAATGGPAT